jgi:hypothetical protein
MTSDDQDAPRDTSRVEPPKIYLAACGVLCDIFWWARRNPPTEEPVPVKDETS